MKYTTLARQLRIAVITNVLMQGCITEEKAKELLSLPLDGKDGPVYDDSSLLGDLDALDKIAAHPDGL